MMLNLSRLGEITERYSGLMSAVPDAVMFIGADNIIQECNDHISKVTGYDRTELEGRPLDILMPDQQAGHEKYFSDFLRAGSPEISPHLDVSIRLKSGSSQPVRISRSCYESGDGPVFVAIMYPT